MSCCGCVVFVVWVFASLFNWRVVDGELCHLFELFIISFIIAVISSICKKTTIGRQWEYSCSTPGSSAGAFSLQSESRSLMKIS